jgi:hypothetical protein
MSQIKMIQAQAAARKKKQQHEDTLERAFKSIHLPMEQSPGAQISTLEKYIAALRELRQEIVDTYSPGEVGRALTGLDVQISQAVEAIVEIRVQTIKPGND